MRKKPTEQQKQAAAERRDRMRKLAKQISAMTDEQREALAGQVAGIVTIEGRALSLLNICMIASQDPTATVVGGFRQWLAAGRCVRKGEHGMAIWIPVAKRKSTDDEKPQDGDGDGVRFMLGTVFDVSQTDEVETREPETAGALWSE